jgi:hypothetical protein
MDRIIPQHLLFDRFPLDLTREFLRAGDQDVKPQPKTLGVMLPWEQCRTCAV